MGKQKKEELNFIKKVANRLAEKFMEPLFEPGKEKNYNAQIGGLAEIIDWSREFYDLYFDKINNWEMFKYSKHNIYNAVILDDLIIAFGKARIIKFYAENKSLENYFLEKYLAVIKGIINFPGPINSHHNLITIKQNILKTQSAKRKF